MPHLEDAGVREGVPVECVALACPPAAGGDTEGRDGAMLDDGQSRSGLGQEGEEEADRLRHFLVGIEDHRPARIAHDPRWGPAAQGAMLGLVQLATQEPVAQPMSRGFAHGALEAQH